jgi:hypothetical protein
MSQAVSCLPHTVEIWVQSLTNPWGIYGGKNDSVLQMLWFCPVSMIPPSSMITDPFITDKARYLPLTVLLNNILKNKET